MLKRIKTNQSFAFALIVLGLCAAFQFLCAEEAAMAKAVKLPFTVFDENGSKSNHFVTSGWMGNTKGIRSDDNCTNNPHAGKTCLRFEYTEAADWAGIVWQDQAGDWGELPGGWNLTGAKKLKFWARGGKGGEIVTFKYGVLGSDKKYSDSSSGELDDVRLSKDWKEYSIDLDGKDLTRIKTGFVWSLSGQGLPVVFFLDDIRYE
jgi:hypothetical protein